MCAMIPKTGRCGSKSIIPQSMKHSADVHVEILSDDKLKIDKKKASRTTLPIACLSQPCLTVGCNQTSPTASYASVKEGLYP